MQKSESHAKNAVVTGQDGYEFDSIFRHIGIPNHALQGCQVGFLRHQRGCYFKGLLKLDFDVIEKHLICKRIEYVRNYDKKSMSEIQSFNLRVYTGWCILSRTPGIPYMVCQRDAPVYYLHVM